MMSHQEASRALGRVRPRCPGARRAELIEAHLADCPRCRAELDAHREVAAALGNSVEPLPEGLWSSIASALMVDPDEEPPPMPTLVRHDEFAVGSFHSPRSAPPRRRAVA